MEHKFIQGATGHPVFILLHGTGGNMNDLIPAAEHLDSQASVLTIQGDVLENGMRRFFKRFPDASFDWDDLEVRGANLVSFIKNASHTYQFDLKDVVLVGYSNGANIAINLLLRDPRIFLRAILFHPMYPTDDIDRQDLTNVSIFASLGVKDPIVTVAQSEQVIKLFENQEAQVTPYWTTGHQLSYSEVEHARQWLKNS
ncbi:alpha/beta hydrolase [Vagococcus zengguangii]|uniref:alpha/beta hydrolase n=1 Tax=Vagococcus zengguangii TaxID=2571750 RepID=UPI001109F20D|nr:alpha/beta hydrolase [Vagococcus zengguangii]TLG81360.1 alpha/beta hydrolase [Vagococcus zengguangii]